MFLCLFLCSLLDKKNQLAIRLECKGVDTDDKSVWYQDWGIKYKVRFS